MFRLVADQRVIFRVLRHVLLIAIMVTLFTWVAWSNQESGISGGGIFLMVLGNAFIFFGYAYITVYLLIPKILLQNNYLLFIFAFLATGFLLSSGKFLVSDYIFYHAIAPEDRLADPSFSLLSILVNIKDMTFIVALFAILKFTRDHFFIKRNIREIEDRRKEAEMKLLRHQMDPHVLFNNFNSLYSISINRPHLLQATVKMLKSNLHYMFHGSRMEKVPLAGELKMIENYIGLEKLRYGDRLKVDYNVRGDVARLEIYPLLLYPFVENCFIHGAGENPSSSWIRIKMDLDGKMLKFCAANSVSGYGGPNSELKDKSSRRSYLRRLEVLYPNSHHISVFSKQSEYIVELNISLT